MERELWWTLIFRNPVPSGHKELPILMLDILLEVKQLEVLLHQDMEENLLSRSNNSAWFCMHIFIIYVEYLYSLFNIKENKMC